MNIGITGTRKGATLRQLATLRRELLVTRQARGQVAFHHGDCVGVDAQSCELARNLGLWAVAHPPVDGRLRAHVRSDEQRPPLPYIERNHAIVDECDVLYVVPSGFVVVQRSGTWATARYAHKVGRSGLVIFPDGTIESLERGLR